MSLLQTATFTDFVGWLFGLVFCALVGLFWFWVTRSISELKDDIAYLSEQFHQFEKNSVRMEEQLRTLRKEMTQFVEKQRKFIFAIKEGHLHEEDEIDE